MNLPWAIRDALGRTPIHLAYLCDTHPDTGWLQFLDWARHVIAMHPAERAEDVAVSYRNSERRTDGRLRLGSTVRHT
jgi:hypothetical protein